jgi:hypothetical protein
MTNGDHIHASANTMPMREPQTGAVVRYDGFVAKFTGRWGTRIFVQPANFARDLPPDRVDD